VARGSDWGFTDLQAGKSCGMEPVGNINMITCPTRSASVGDLVPREPEVIRSSDSWFDSTGTAMECDIDRNWTVQDTESSRPLPLYQTDNDYAGVRMGAGPRRGFDAEPG
jgi:hypothetical protein